MSSQCPQVDSILIPAPAAFCNSPIDMCAFGTRGHVGEPAGVCEHKCGSMRAHVCECA